MKTNLILLNSCLVLFLAGPGAVWAQPAGPVIGSFGRNGELVCTNLEPGTTATVEWAPAVTGPWTNTWAGLEAVTVETNSAIRVSVPMFYRVRGMPRNPDPTNLIWISSGTFTMGSPDSELGRNSDEGPQTSVTLTHGFWMGKHEVRQWEYLAVMGNNPSSFPGDLNRPVEMVSWNDAVAYCAALTTRERSAGRLPAGYVYRLPTEAEWEYACRAGTTTPFHYGNALLSGMANFDGHYEYPPCGGDPWCYNSSGIYLGRTTSVGSYAPNAWGLYDMHGNVWEWCQDWWSSNLPGGSVTDPQGSTTGSVRVLRGASWSGLAAYCRSADRGSGWPGDGYINFGFRVVLAPGLP